MCLKDHASTDMISSRASSEHIVEFAQLSKMRLLRVDASASGGDIVKISNV